jgi:hypothetical protein
MQALVRPVLVLSLLTAHGPLGMAQETTRIRLVNNYAVQINLGFATAERTRVSRRRCLAGRFPHPVRAIIQAIRGQRSRRSWLVRWRFL